MSETKVSVDLPASVWATVVRSMAMQLNVSAAADSITRLHREEQAETAKQLAAGLTADLAAARAEVETLTAKVAELDSDYCATDDDLANSRDEVEALKARIRELEARPAAATPREDARRRIEAKMRELWPTDHYMRGRWVDLLAAEFPDTAPAVTRERVREAVRDMGAANDHTKNVFDNYADALCDRLGIPAEGNPCVNG